MDLNFRVLNADEIECKASLIGNVIEVSLHVQAATCTRMLNEQVGPMNWEKEYTNGNKNCVVRIWDSDKNRMIAKEDCGGSLTEIDGYKGQASNGFKRVCALGWGLGIELYSQPTILLQKTDDNTVCDDKNNLVVCEKYTVKTIEYTEDKKISRCVIVDSKGVVVYDGPKEDGSGAVVAVVEDEEVIIPENADMEEALKQEAEESVDKTAEIAAYEKELPDNTDGYDDCESQPAPFTINYRKEFEAEIKRTHVKRSDVLRALKIESFEALNTVADDVLDATLSKLKKMPTYNA